MMGLSEQKSTLDEITFGDNQRANDAVESMVDTDEQKIEASETRDDLENME